MREIRLVETDLPCTNDFEAFWALVNGYVIRCNTDGDILRLSNGHLQWNNSGSPKGYIVWNFGKFTICKEEPMEWWDNIPEKGILCKVTDTDSIKPTIRLIKSKSKFSFIDDKSIYWSSAEPVTIEELQEVIYKGD